MNQIIKAIAPYNKFLLALLGAVLTVLTQYYGTDHRVQIAVAFLTALGVYAVPNLSHE